MLASLLRHPHPLQLLAALTLAAATACSAGGGREEADASATVPLTTSATADITTTSSSSTGAPTTGGVDGSGTTTTGESTAVDPTTGAPATTTTGETTPASSDDTTGPMPDLGGPVCDPNDICCLMEGQIPPHKLLESFLAVYPPVNMPKSVAAVQAFEPMADGHAMAWSDENVGGELVDAANGGVIEANVQAGRMLSRTAAEMALPPGSTILEVREDPVIIEDLGGPPPCIGVGWGWGSILFEGADTSIGELVYLYIGYCADGDVEVFYYSDQSVEICPPPG